MFFCPNCNNSFDITRTKTAQEGKGKGHEKEITGGDNSYQDIIDKVINNTFISEDEVKDIDMEKLTKQPEFKDLKSKQKEIVFNKIHDLLPTEKKKVKNIQDDGSEKEDINENLLAYFVCNNCGYSEIIKPGTKIFSRTSESLSQNYTVNDYSEMVNSDILPRTRKYVCPNNECVSHKDISKREAVFFRLINSYKIKYVCTACDTDF